MQRLAEQQQKLMAFIAETEELALKVESDAFLTNSDIAGMKGHLDQWCTCLETLDEKKKRIQEEKEKEEAEKRKREEEERHRKEREEREAEEKRRRREEEKKKRDWKNWPAFIYKNWGRNKFDQNICCIIYAYPDGIKEKDFQCDVSDMDSDLDKCLESNDEQIISSMVTVKFTNPTELKMPIRIYVPAVTHDQHLEPKLKFQINGQNKWYTGKTLPTFDKKELQGITFVGVEIPVKNLKQLLCIAVARHKRDETEVDEDGKVFELEGDRNIKVKFPPRAFPGKTIIATKSVPWINKDIKNASKKHKELMNIKTAGSYIDITCEQNTKQDSDLEMYDFGWVVDKSLNKKQSVNQETLNRCSRWLVNHMSLTDSDLEDVFDSDFLEHFQTTETEGDKNRIILRELYESNDSDFDTFLQRLKSKQPSVADRIKNVQVQVRLSRRSTEVSEDDFGNDFDPDFVMKEGKVCVVSKVTGKSWEVVPLQASDEHPKARFVKLPAGNNKYQVLGLVVPDDMKDEDICRAAEILEGLNFITNVSVICRQKHSNPHDVIIECVRSEKVLDTLQHLDILGYNDGPAESTEFGVVDGETIEVRMQHNLFLEGYKRSLLIFKFYNNLPFERYFCKVGIASKSDQGEDDRYHGYLEYCVPPGRLTIQRQGKMVVYVPKPLEELVGNFPYTLNVQVKALAKFIAWQLTKDNFISTRWVRHAGYLTQGDKRMYHDIVKHIDNEKAGAPERERCELFIVYWSDHHAHPDDDKIDKIIKAHHDQKLESEAQQFIKPYLQGSGIFSNDNLEKMAYTIAVDWESMAKRLGFSNDVINQITNSQPGGVRRTLRMLDLWRLSDSAIQKGTDLVKYFHDSAKSAQCGAKLLSMISNDC